MTSVRQVAELSRTILAGHRGSIAVFKVYLDESGVHDSSPVVAVGGYIGRPPAWRDWTKKWNQAKKPIKIYHATDAQNLQGEFEGWTNERVGALAAKLLPIIDQSQIGALSISLDLVEFNRALAGKDHLKKLFGEPYVACFQWCIQAFLNIAYEGGNKERIAFVHEVNAYQGQALEAFSWIKENTNMGNNAISLTFGAKSDYPPLQAADILAYETNKRLRNVERPERRAWTALGGSKFALAYGKKNMDELVTALEKIYAGKSDQIRFSRSDLAPLWLGKMT